MKGITGVRSILQFQKTLTYLTTRNQSTFTQKLTVTSQNDGIRNIMLNNEKTRNSLSLEMMDEILENLTKNQNDSNLRCVVLSGKGSVFSAGHNLKELTPEKGSEFHKIVFARCSELMLAILKSPVPVIAKVDGLAAAAGCQLIATCDLVVCSDKSSFSTPGASFGIFCSTPGIAVARAIPRMKASHMLLTGLPIKADEALAAGLVSSVVPQEKLDEEMDKITNAIKSKSRSVIELGKKFFYEQISMDIKTAYDVGGKVMTTNISMDDGKEGIKSFVEKRKPVWKA